MDFKNCHDYCSNLILYAMGIALIIFLAFGCYWLHEDIMIKKLNMRVLFED
jgi:hypothetical protein